MDVWCWCRCNWISTSKYLLFCVYSALSGRCSREFICRRCRDVSDVTVSVFDDHRKTKPNSVSIEFQLHEIEIVWKKSEEQKNKRKYQYVVTKWKFIWIVDASKKKSAQLKISQKINTLKHYSQTHTKIKARSDQKKNQKRIGNTSTCVLHIL